jgi:phenylacetate-CoA ligase
MTDFSAAGKLEFLPPGEIQTVQEQLLRRHLQYAAAASPFYRGLFAAAAVDPSSVTIETLKNIPVTDRAVFGERNRDFLAVPMEAVVDIVLSSGTTGLPISVMYTENDLQRLAYNEEISFAACGITQTDIVLLTCTIDRCFIAGLAYYSGARKRGAAVIRNGLANVESHLEIIRRLQPTVIVGVPTFLLKLGRYLESHGIAPARSGVKKLVCIGEPIRDRQLGFIRAGEELESLWQAKVYSTYASSETITSFCECIAQTGGHLHPDLAIVEILDENGQQLGPDEVGEVVVTPLGIEGMPLVRFKTGDISFLIDSPCACGRNSVRLGPILGRKKQMMKLKGTTIYPESIYAVLDNIAGVAEYFVTAASDYDLSDTVKVYVAVSDTCCSKDLIVDKLQAALRVRPEVIITSEETVNRWKNAGNARKLIKFIDDRVTHG